MIPEPKKNDFPDDHLYVTQERSLWRAVIMLVWLVVTLAIQAWLGYAAVQHGLLSLVAVMLGLSLVQMAGIQQINRF